MTTIQELIRVSSMSVEDRDAYRLRQIEALQREGMATWDEETEAFQIRRRQILRRAFL